MDPYPLRTKRPHRILAWPRWQDVAELDLLLKTFARSLVNRPDVTLVLRHDAQRDGEASAHIALFQTRYDLAFGPDDALSVLVLDETLGEADLPRLGAALDGALALPSSEHPERAVFLEDLGCRLISRVSDLGAMLPGAPASSPPVRARSGSTPSTPLNVALIHVAREAVNRAAPDLLTATWGPPPPTLLPLGKEDLSHLTVETVPPGLARRFGWVHVSGNRTGRAVAEALEWSNRALSGTGWVAVEDFFSTRYPQVTWAVLRHLTQYPYALAPVLLVENTLFLCAPLAWDAWDAWVKTQLLSSLQRAGAPAGHLSHTTYPQDLALTSLLAGEGPAEGPDWDSDQVPW